MEIGTQGSTFYEVHKRGWNKSYFIIKKVKKGTTLLVMKEYILVIGVWYSILQFHT